MKELYLNYGYTPDKEAIDRSLELIASNLENLVSDSVIKECFSLMDLTSLHNADSVNSITKLMEKVNTYRDIYPGYPLPASVCVYPNLAHVVKECRKEEAVHVTAVAGCFQVHKYSSSTHHPMTHWKSGIVQSVNEITGFKSDAGFGYFQNLFYNRSRNNLVLRIDPGSFPNSERKGERPGQVQFLFRCLGDDGK